MLSLSSSLLIFPSLPAISFPCGGGGGQPCGPLCSSVLLLPPSSGRETGTDLRVSLCVISSSPVPRGQDNPRHAAVKSAPVLVLPPPTAPRGPC